MCVTIREVSPFKECYTDFNGVECLSIQTLIHCTCVCCSRLLSTAQGSLLDDEVLVNTLQSSKKTSEEVSEQLVVAEQTEAKIDSAREVS